MVYRIWGSRRKIATDNLRAAVGRGVLSIEGSPEDLVYLNFMNMGRSLAEVVKAYYGLGEKLVRAVSFEGLENFERAKAAGKGVIIITGHCGNWELMQLAVSSRLGGLSVVARKQDNPYLNAFIERTRERYGSRVIYKQGALRKLLTALKEGGTTGVVMDQAVFPEEGVLINFLGAPAWTMKTPAVLGKRTGAAILPVFMRRADGGYVITVHPPVELSGDESEDTKRISRPIEDYVRQNPADWLWMHRRWKRAGNEIN